MDIEPYAICAEQQHAARGQHPLPSPAALTRKTEVVSMPGMKLCAKLATRQREQRVTVLEKLIIFCTQTPERGEGVRWVVVVVGFIQSVSRLH